MARQLTVGQRERVAEKIMDWGNLIFIGMVVAQVVPGPLSEPVLIPVGIVGIAGAYLFAIRLMKGKAVRKKKGGEDK